jgi:hypothetical protein
VFHICKCFFDKVDIQVSSLELCVVAVGCCYEVRLLLAGPTTSTYYSPCVSSSFLFGRLPSSHFLHWHLCTGLQGRCQIFLYCIFLGYLCILYFSAARQRPVHGTVPSQLGTRLTELAVCWGGAGFEPGAANLQFLLPLSHRFS